MLETPTYRSYLDTVLVVAIIVLLGAGLLAIYSATRSTDSKIFEGNFLKQVAWSVLGLVALALTLLFPVRFFEKIAYGLYGLSLILLVAILFVGHGASGASRWLVVGPLWLQPSEISKFALVLALARYLSRERRDLEKIHDLVVTVAFVIAPLILVLKQPDLGTSLVYFAVLLPMLYWAGLPPFTMFVMVAPLLSLMSAFNFYTFSAAMAIIALVLFLSRRGFWTFVVNFALNAFVGIITPVLWSHLHGYQQRRILTFLGLYQDPQGAGYQVIQSKVAIGSGGLLGKGFLHGTQTQLRFLPEQHTDFIFSVVGEEFGFIGALAVLGCFLYLLLRGLDIASEAHNRFASLASIGIVSILAFQVFVNVGMASGLLPVVGVPLPLISYGGSSLLTTLVMLGFLLNTSRRRQEY